MPTSSNGLFDLPGDLMHSDDSQSYDCYIKR
jgi:hypothetical protein